MAALPTHQRHELDSFHWRFILFLEYMIIRMIVKQIMTPKNLCNMGLSVPILSQAKGLF